MSNFDNKMIQEAAYYIWKNNGCPNNTSASDWQAAIDQLERQDALATARQLSAQYSHCTLLPNLSLNLNKIKSANVPFALVKHFGNKSAKSAASAKVTAINKAPASKAKAAANSSKTAVKAVAAKVANAKVKKASASTKVKAAAKASFDKCLDAFIKGMSAK